MADLIVANFIDENFLSGCVGAIAPEALRLYNLRTEPVFRWSPSYLVCIIPFIFIGGCVAWFLEPTTKWAAFYSGLTAPVLLSTALKDSVKAQKDLAEIQNEFEKLKQENNSSEEEINQLKLENKKLQSLLQSLSIQTPKKGTESLPCPAPSFENDSTVLGRNYSYNNADIDPTHISISPSSPTGFSKPIKKNTKILLAWFLVIIAILLAITFTVLDLKIALLLLFLVLCNILVAPRISKNKFFQEYFKGL